jgi:hypothetical protein
MLRTNTNPARQRGQIAAPAAQESMEMRRFKLPTLVALALTLGLAAAPAAKADLCAIDNVPAATLLLPYFEVDLVNEDCVNTLFSLNNASATPTIAHVVLWTDWSQPTIDFDIFLTGYDVVTVNLRDLFVFGNIPITADEQSDPDDSISPHGGVYGSHPEWDGSFVDDPDCINFFPFFQNPMITGFRRDILVNGHTGAPVGHYGGRCIGHNHGDGWARGYLTIDDARRCGLEDPTMDVYFGGADPVATNDNQLWGDFFIVDPPNNFAIGEPLVHIEAGESIDPATGYTFYGRYTAAAGGDDLREPLGTSWAARYLNGGSFVGGTNLFVWRDSTTNNQGSFTCGVGPDWLPLNETEVIAFDEEENAVELCFSGPGGVISPPEPGEDPTCFPLETQRTVVGTGDLDPPTNFGWMFLNLNINDVGVTGDVDFGAAGNLAQSYVISEHRALGRFAVGLSAISLSHACDDLNPLLGGSLP